MIWMSVNEGGGDFKTDEVGQAGQGFEKVKFCRTSFDGPLTLLYVATWNEHMSVSSTLIIAPALSNSPQ